jgi:hypothetical protein
MTNVKQIINLLGGFETLAERPIKLRVDGFMPLSIEFVGRGPRGGTLISVMHWFMENGDLCRDPDLEIEIPANSDDWLPVSYRQDSLGVYQQAVIIGENGPVVRASLTKDLIRFMRRWDKNVGDQGFVQAARTLAKQRGSGYQPTEEAGQ